MEYSQEIKHKILITGTGRSGTTFLVQLFTALGLNTGFKDINEGISNDCSAGMEVVFEGPTYIIKGPALCDLIGNIMNTGQYTIDHVFIPIRNLRDATNSRIRVAEKFKHGIWKSILKKEKYKMVPGGLWETQDPHAQYYILAEKFYRLIFDLTKYGIPFTLMLFPAIVTDGLYLYNHIHPVFPEISYEDFEKAFSQVSNPNLVHKYS